jgi:hypothetical protein
MGSKGDKKVDSKPLDNSKSKPSIRGVLIPYVLGAERLGPLFGAVGQRTTYLQAEESSAGGGKGGGDVDTVTYTTYYQERGWHILSTGIGRRLRIIDTDGITQTDITRAQYPSGSTVSAGDLGVFKVYWGEDSHPTNSFLNSHLGITSQWPHIFAVVWQPRELGTSATWPATEYEIEVETQLSTVGGKPTYIKTNGFSASGVNMDHQQRDDTFFITTDPVAAGFRPGYKIESPANNYVATILSIEEPSTGTYHVYTDVFAYFTGVQSFNITGQPKSGVNPAAAIWQMLFEPFPFGMGMNQKYFELSDFDALAELFAEDGDEPFPCQVSLSAGKSFKEGIGYILQDAGISWWIDADTGKYRFTAVREPEVGEDPIAILSSDYKETDLDVKYDYSTLSAKNIVYGFDDINRRFNRTTIRESDDGTLKLSDDPNSTKIELNSVTDFNTATIVSSRRSQEKQEQESIPVTLPEAFTNIPLGGLYTIEGLDGEYRLRTKTYDTKSYQVKAQFVKDVYSITNDFVEQEQILIQNALLGPYPDPLVNILEVNRAFSADQNGVIITKVRAHGQVSSSDIYLSPDNTSYNRIAGPVGFATGGRLLEDLPDTDPTLIDDGPLISNVGPDILEVADLTSSEEIWRSGSQVCVINTEVFFLRSILVVAEGQYRLQGLIRARVGTSIENHLIGDDVYILPSSLFVASNPTYLAKGADIYAKTLPRTANASLTLDQVDEVSLTYQGGGFRPLPVSNLNTDENNYAWDAGEDIVLKWSYKNASASSSAGILRTGEAGVPEDPEGTFTIFFTDGVDTKGTVTDLTSAEYTYTNAQLVSDFGLEPASFNVIVVNVLNGLVSDPVEITLTKL